MTYVELIDKCYSITLKNLTVCKKIIILVGKKISSNLFKIKIIDKLSPNKYYMNNHFNYVQTNYWC